MIQTYPDLEALSRGAAELFVQLAQQAVQARGRFSVALSGGNTPRRAYELLAQPPLRDQVPWNAVHVFWGDERFVPPDDPRSNERMARLTLLDHVPVPPSQIYPMFEAGTPAQAAARYEAILRRFFTNQRPQLDLVLLGLGDNGHTLSLFPGTPVLDEHQKWVADVYVAEQDMYRVTMTAPLVNQAAVLAFLVSGADKAEVLREIVTGKPDYHRLPAILIQPAHGELRWLLDRAAAARLPG